MWAKDEEVNEEGFSNFVIKKGTNVIYTNHPGFKIGDSKIGSDGKSTGESYTREEFKNKILINFKAAYSKYKDGGYVNYTGPAWVDGTPTKPEAFLNASDTQRMEALIGVLQQLGTGLKSPTVSPNPTSNQTSNSIQVEINVDELGSEYDVEQLARDVQNTIYKNMTKGQTTFLR